MLEIIDYKEFTEIINKEFVVVLAKSKNCSVCISVSNQLEKILKNYYKTLYSVYIDQVPEFSGQFLVFTVPAVLIFSQGKEILREVRFINFNKIEKLLQQNFKGV